MSRRERLRISFNMDNPQHVVTWKQLQVCDSSQRSDYVIQCVAQAAETDRLQNAFIHILDSCLKHMQPLLRTETATCPDELPSSLLDFVDAL